MYTDAYLLPEFEGEEGDGNLSDIDLADEIRFLMMLQDWCHAPTGQYLFNSEK